MPPTNTAKRRPVPRFLRPNRNEKKDFTVPDDTNGWNYRLVFNSTDGEGKPTEKSIYVNRFSLAALSPVFAKIFFDLNFSDASKSEMTMNGKVFSEFYEFINCVAVPYKSLETDRKEIDMNNLGILLRYADEYEIETLKGRCNTFIDEQNKALKINMKVDRDQLVRLFAIVTEVPNCIDINLRRKLSRFAFPEIQALASMVDPSVLLAITQDKLRRYSSLLASPAPNRHNEGSGRCDQCSRTKQELQSCVGCPLNGGGDRFCLCADCFDNYHVGVHNDYLRHLCPACRKPFKHSTVSTPDRCGCTG